MSGLPEHCPASADAVTPDSARDIGAPTVIFQSDTIDAGMAGPGRENLLSGLRRRPGKSPCKVFRSPSSSQWRPSSRILRHWMYRPKEGLSVPGAFHDPFILTAFGRRYARSVCGCFCVPGIVAFSCVVERRHSLAGANPARQLSLHHLSHERESPRSNTLQPERRRFLFPEALPNARRSIELRWRCGPLSGGRADIGGVGFRLERVGGET